MKSAKSPEESQQSLLQSFNVVSAILKTIGEPNRFKILILLLTGPKSFQTLLNEIGLKKSALANHLSHLKKYFLIEKKQHGIYNITNDGKNYIQAIELIYEQSIAQDLVQQRYQVAKAFLERKKETNRGEKEWSKE